MRRRAFAEVGEVERHVGVGVEHEIAAGLAEAGAHAAAELAVHGVVDDPHARVGRRELVGDLAGGIGGRVVDEEDLVVADVTRRDEVVARLARGADRAMDHLLFVPHREHEREAAERWLHDQV